jgi:hypothetical protein
MTPTHHPHILKTKQLVKDRLNSTHNRMMCRRLGGYIERK